MDYSLLDCQATFCQSKGRLDWALECAKRSVTAAPSEFGTWAKLAEIYVGLEEWDLALLTLNSCPMFTYQDKDAPRMPEPARVLLPILPETVLDELDESSQGYDAELIHPSLRKLHAASYKGTFLKAYSILTEITSKIGWDQLLKIRSQVFVMEEEYRSEKQIGSHPQAASNRNASTTALRDPSPTSEPNGETSMNHTNGETDTSSNATTAVHREPIDGDSGNATLAADESIEKPEHTITSEEAKAGSEDVCPSLFDSLSCRGPLIDCSPIRIIPLIRTFRTSDCASDGLTTSSWFSTKICVYIRSGELTWLGPPLTLRVLTLRTIHTTNRRKNGRSWASWQSDYTTIKKQSKHTSIA